MATPFDYSVDALIVAVRDYIGISPNSEDGTDARILRLLNREQSLYLATLLTKAKGQHRQSTLTYPTVPTTLRYDIPQRAIAAGLKMLEVVDVSGRSWMLFNYPDEDNARYGGFSVNNNAGQFYIEGNQLVFYSAPPSGTLKVTYSRRLSALVQAVSAAVITSINTGNGSVGVSVVPAGLVSGQSFDLVRANPHFDILAMAQTAIILSTTISFGAGNLPTGLAVGDYVCVAGQTPVCQAPYELHPVLAQRAAFKWLEAKGDERTSVAKDSLEQMAADAMSLIEPRLEEESPLVNRYAPGWNRWSLGRYR